MNEEKIREALKIIKEPITVNCIEYKYFDEENYNKLLEVYDNCLWFANNFEQINLTVDNLLKENQKLKDEIYKSNAVADTNIELAEKYYKENQQLKEQLQQKEDIINKTKEYNNQIIKDTKEFYRPTSDLIYSGDCLIDLAEQNIKILDNKGE